jgi:stage III sporulation protein AH
MINKKNLWFLTLFSLILVLSVYYITMPSELLLTNGTVAEDSSTIDDSVSISESEILTTLRVESDEELLSELDSLKLVLNDSKSSVDEKNDAFDKMKELNINKSKELELEKIVEDDLKIQTFIKIKGDQIKVIVDKQEHDTALANSIMRVIQDEFDTKKYITVQFKAS